MNKQQHFNIDNASFIQVRKQPQIFWGVGAGRQRTNMGTGVARNFSRRRPKNAPRSRPPKASKWKRMGRECPPPWKKGPPSPADYGTGERRKLPPARSGAEPGRKRLLVYLELERTHMATYLIFVQHIVTFTLTVTKHKTSCIYLPLLHS